MDNIYRSASLTIVAAAGSDANAGLPDVRRPRTVTQHVAMVKGYELTTVPELPTFAIESSVWSQRAWTYQEQTLSYRMLGVLTSRPTSVVSPPTLKSLSTKPRSMTVTLAGHTHRKWFKSHEKQEDNGRSANHYWVIC